MVLAIGSEAPAVSGWTQDGPHGLLFFKVTCPTCQMAAPPLSMFEEAFPGKVLGVGQDPAAAIASFSEEFGFELRSVSDAPPYEASRAYRIEHVPTLVLVDADGKVADIVESWDRDGYNRASAALGELLGAQAPVISEPDDGLPAFRPG